MHPEKQKKTWVSAVYKHYHPPEILISGETVKYVFVCKRYVVMELSFINAF
jgi:hypothetical protein